MHKTTIILVTTALLFASDGQAKRSSDQAKLKVYGGLVGEWKGTGQPQRGSAKGAWTEKGDWSWKLSSDTASLLFQAPNGKYIRSAKLSPGNAAGEFTLDASLADGSQRTYAGKAGARNVLVLTTESKDGTGPSKITLTPLHDTRFLLLLEGPTDSGAHTRLGEIGFTRQGVPFATGESAPVCIVTEGRGTIAVTHKGKTYYVCCSGCKDLFSEDPEGVLAEAALRAKAKGK